MCSKAVNSWQFHVSNGSSLLSATNPTSSLSPHSRETFGGEQKPGQNTVFHVPVTTLGSSRLPCMADRCTTNRSHGGTWNSYHVLCQLHINSKIASCLAGHFVSSCAVVTLKTIWVFGTSSDSSCTGTRGRGGQPACWGG